MIIKWSLQIKPTTVYVEHNQYFTGTQSGYMYNILDKMSENLILTAVHSIKMCGPPLMANWSTSSPSMFAVVHHSQEKTDKWDEVKTRPYNVNCKEAMAPSSLRHIPAFYLLEVLSSDYETKIHCKWTMALPLD